jgi:hypothetical protein
LQAKKENGIQDARHAKQTRTAYAQRPAEGLYIDFTLLTKFKRKFEIVFILFEKKLGGALIST